MWSRIHLIPMLQAEEDRDQVRRMYADKARERQLLGAETRVYNTDRYVFVFLSLLLDRVLGPGKGCSIERGQRVKGALWAGVLIANV